MTCRTHRHALKRTGTGNSRKESDLLEVIVTDGNRIEIHLKQILSEEFYWILIAQDKDKLSNRRNRAVFSQVP
jgi:hypothetical protein